jgi:hypothetical protein
MNQHETPAEAAARLTHRPRLMTLEEKMDPVHTACVGTTARAVVELSQVAGVWRRHAVRDAAGPEPAFLGDR